MEALITPPPSSLPHHEIAAAIVVDGGRVLMCHRHPDRRWYPDIWDLPGGHVEEGESPERALARELHEELGIVVDPAAVGARHTLTPEEGLTIHVWVLRAWSGAVSNRAPAEHDRLGWYLPGDVAGLELPDRVLVDLCRRAVGSNQLDEQSHR